MKEEEEEKVMGKKIDASEIASPFREAVRKEVARLKEQGIEAPKLVGLLANKDPAAKKYAEWTGRACQNDGLQYELRTISDPIDVEPTLLAANDDPTIHGIIVYYPIFGGGSSNTSDAITSFSGDSQDDYLRDTISYTRDVEGLCHTYRFNLYRNVRYLDPPHNIQKCILPCTALSVIKILEYLHCYDNQKPIRRRLEGRVITVINRSEIVGRPVAAMMANDGATVYSVDIESIYVFRDGGKLHPCNDGETVESCVRKSSVVITGVPTKQYRLPTSWIQPNTTIINVSSYKNVDETSLLQIPGVQYVPMVGKVTVAMLERNLVRLFENFHLSRYNNNNNRRVVVGGGGEEKKESSMNTTTTLFLQVYTAVTITALLAVQLFYIRKGK